jgi:hypothetical protein
MTGGGGKLLEASRCKYSPLSPAYCSISGAWNDSIVDEREIEREILASCFPGHGDLVDSRWQERGKERKGGWDLVGGCGSSYTLCYTRG